MKKATAFLLFLSVIFVFASCKTSKNEETTLSGETTFTEENVSYATESQESNETVSKNDDSVKTSISEEESVTEISVSATETTEVLLGKTQPEVTTVKEDLVIVTDDKIIAPEYSLEIPEDFEIKSEGNDSLLENEQGTIQFNIMDKTKVVTNFEEYAKDTYRSASASGLANGELEEVTVNGITMKRFAMTMLDDDGVQLEAYAYLAQINNKVFMITLTSKDGGLADVAAADAFVAEIDFAAQ